MKKVLHLYSNHKWTGPADHALNLASWLKMRDDVATYFACGRRPGVQNPLYDKAGRRGLKPLTGLYLKKHLSSAVYLLQDREPFPNKTCTE